MLYAKYTPMLLPLGRIRILAVRVARLNLAVAAMDDMLDILVLRNLPAVCYCLNLCVEYLGCPRAATLFACPGVRAMWRSMLLFDCLSHDQFPFSPIVVTYFQQSQWGRPLLPQ